MLEWSVTLEKNLDHYTIERSRDGIYFTSYGKVLPKGHGSSTQIIYTFTDELPLGGLSYYRLKSTDLDGIIEFHGVLAVKMKNRDPEILIYPNPSLENFVVASYSGISEKNYSIMDISGITIQEGILVPGINEIHFDVRLDPGYYIFRLDDSQGIYKKIIVR